MIGRINLLKRSFAAAFIFIGSTIGAGFMSGQEIALFFGGQSPWAGVAAGVVLGALCSLFLYLGNSDENPGCFFPRGIGNRGGFFKPLHNAAVFVSALSMLATMTAGAETAMRELFGIPLFGMVCLLTGIILVTFGLKQIAVLNLIFMPLIVVFIAILFFKSSVPPNLSGGINPLSPIAYGALNVFLSGSVLTKIKLNKKEIRGAGIITAVILSVVIFMLQCVISSENLGGASMPVLSAAAEYGLKALAGILIFAAILTTLVSSLFLLVEMSEGFATNMRKMQSPQGNGINGYREKNADGKRRPQAPTADAAAKYEEIGAARRLFNRAVAGVSWGLIALPLSLINFTDLVAGTYPVISALGVIYTLYAIFRLMLPRLKLSRNAP
ncbi:MAG: hypothetical protein LBC13_03990 [Clostridiales bacterium]|jgi:uncharacterized membrane protein YkvI|nr:hypothetical protein [Clostridiales bacterium]